MAVKNQNILENNSVLFIYDPKTPKWGHKYKFICNPIIYRVLEPHWRQGSCKD